MATLTETAYYARKTISYGAIGIVAFFITRGLLLAGIAYYRKLHPPPPPPPTVLFGKLPAIVYPEKSQPALIYRLETVTGSTPDLGDRATVYFMPVRQANLLALDRMKNLAKILNFDSEPEQLSPTRYKWWRDNPLPTALTADIISGSFELLASWQTDNTILTQKNLPDGGQAVYEAQNFLQNAGLLANDLLTGKTTITWLKTDVRDLIKAMSLSEADFVRIDFFRAPINDLIVYTPNIERGVVSLVFSGNRTTGKRVVELNYNYFPVNYDQSATYPIKSSSQAWEELQANQGFVAGVDPEADNVVVRKISLGYFDSPIPQHYLQPVYVFEGDGNFVGYVSAIDASWIE